MRKAFLYIILTLLLSVSCTQKEPATYMLRPHEELPKEIASDRSFTKIFLAGTIDMGNSRDWQLELYDRFSRMDGRYLLFNPRQEHWDASRPGEMGLHAKSDKIHVICEKDFYRYDNVRITCEYYGVPLYNNLESYLDNFTY